jgi:hypothetical protein
MANKTDKGGSTMKIICTMCGESMQFSGEQNGYESYWCEDCDLEGHVKLEQEA